MYYAVDGGNAEQLIQALGEQVRQSSESGHWYGLLDLSFDHEEGRRLSRWPLPTWPLYHAMPLHTMGHVSPCLFALPLTTDSDDWSRQVGQLIRHAYGRPMLSFVHSRLDGSALQSAWQTSLFVYTADKLRMLLRFADTRVTPELSRTLSQSNWARICQPLLKWLIVDRDGTLISLPLGESSDPLDLADKPIELNDAEYAGLVAQGQPDALINSVYEGIPEWLPQKEKAILHKQMKQVVALAEKFQIDKAPDQIALATAVCVSQGALLTSAELDQVLGSPESWPNSNLYDALLPLLSVEEEAK